MAAGASAWFGLDRYGLKTAGKSAARMLPLLLEVLPPRFTLTRNSAFL